MVLVFGTFDKFHPGHEWFLQTAKTYGDRLVVVVARDHNVLTVKGHWPHQSEQQRLQRVQHCNVVDQAVLGLEDYAHKEDIIQQLQPNIICLGYDQAPNFVSPSPDIQVVRLEAFYPERYKSSLL